MSKKAILGVAFVGFIAGVVSAPELKQSTDDLQAYKQIFDVYFAVPCRENAEKALAALPDRIDVKDVRNLNKVMDVFYQEHIRDLDRLVSTGDRYALRIAFKAAQLMDGLYQESLDALIGFSIKVAPLIFLEEAVPFIRSQSQWFASLGVGSSIDWILDGILVGNIDFDQNRPDVIKKEIVLRIAALETVNQENLLELRDSCLRILRERIMQSRFGSLLPSQLPFSLLPREFNDLR